MKTLKKQFFLIRHAESLANIGLDSGYDPDLSPAGYTQVAQLAERIKTMCDSKSVIMSSPFIRCLRTSQAIAKLLNLEILLEPALHEYFAVGWYPLNNLVLPELNQIAKTNPYVAKKDYPSGQWWPSKNENAQDLSIRLGMLRNRLLSDRVPDGKIICVGHWASVAGLITLMCSGIYIQVVNNAGISKINFNGISCEPVFLNDTSHLDNTIIPSDLTQTK